MRRPRPHWIPPPARGLANAVALAIHFEDVDVMGEPFEERFA